MLDEYVSKEHLYGWTYELRKTFLSIPARCASRGNLATIEVLLDQDAVRSGAAARGEPWKYYDLGHGYCVNDFWAECKHRMA